MKTPIKYILISALALIPLSAHAADNGTKVFYKDGTVIQFPDAGSELKLNMQVQPRFSYSDFGRSAERGFADTDDFGLKRVRLIVSGNVLDNQFSYKMQNDFVGAKNADGTNISNLKDAYIQWNADPAAKLRMGQFKVPYQRPQPEGSGRSDVDQN